MIQWCTVRQSCSRNEEAHLSYWKRADFEPVHHMSDMECIFSLVIGDFYP